jgi:hypothetical protein
VDAAAGIGAGRPGSDIDAVMGGDGGGDDDACESADPPEFLAGVGLVSGEFEGASDEELRAVRAVPEGRGGVAADGGGTFLSPEGLAGVAVEGEEVAGGILVAEEVEFVLEKDGRAGGAEFILERAERAGPDGVALEIVTDEAVGAEEGVEVFAGGGDGGGGGAAGAVERFDLGGRDGSFPEEIACELVEGNGGEFLVCFVEGGEKDFVVSKDGGGVPRVDGCLPAEVLRQVEAMGKRAGVLGGQAEVGTEVLGSTEGRGRAEKEKKEEREGKSEWAKVEARGEASVQGGKRHKVVYHGGRGGTMRKNLGNGGPIRGGRRQGRPSAATKHDLRSPGGAASSGGIEAVGVRGI